MPDEDFYKSLKIRNEFDLKLAKAERKWEFRYNQQKKKQRELEETIVKLRARIKELKNGNKDT
tara:strand:+ start:2718 stop:2906 length:189 start_codon:yes stop_codon:yes gene_type:complete